MNENRKKYVDECRSKNAEVLKEKFLLRYERDKTGRKVGVVLAFKNQEGNVLLGWSRCNVKAEPFDRHIGINKAVTRAIALKDAHPSNYVDINHTLDIPHNLRDYVQDMRERAESYFQVGIKPRLYV